jgi:hypothetical protein
MPHNLAYEFGPYRLDLNKRVLMRVGETISLPPKALEILIVLVLRAGELVEKDELLKQFGLTRLSRSRISRRTSSRCGAPWATSVLIRDTSKPSRGAAIASSHASDPLALTTTGLEMLRRWLRPSVP